MIQKLQYPEPFVQSDPDAWEIIYYPESQKVRFDYAQEGATEVSKTIYFTLDAFLNILKQGDKH
jgi:hypothetical protein